MTHLAIGTYTANNITAVWGNLEYDNYMLDGAIHRVEPLGTYDMLVKVVRDDAKIIRPKQLTIFTNDRSLAAMFARPIRLKFEYFGLIRQLAGINKWAVTYTDNLPKAKGIWEEYRKRSQ